MAGDGDIEEFCLLDDDVFEPLHRYVAGDEFAALVRARAPEYDIQRSGPYLSATRDGECPGQPGLAVYVSTTAADAPTVFDQVATHAAAAGAPFDIAADTWMLQWISSRRAPYRRAGKCAVVHPATPAQRDALVPKLDAALADLRGPEIPSAVPYRSSTSIYTAGSGRTVTPSELRGGRYTIGAVLHRSASGVVYRAADTHSGKPVVVKEAHAGIGLGNGRDTTPLRMREHSILRDIAGRGIAPAVVDFFHLGERPVLVEEYVDGWDLADVATRANPVYDPGATPQQLRSYYLLMLRLWRELAVVVDGLHRCGIVHGDLSWRNVRITAPTDGSRATVRLLDFESAVRLGGDAVTGLWTPGFGPAPRHVEEFGPRWDSFAIGSAILASLYQCQPLTCLDQSADARFLTALAPVFGFGEDLVGLVTSLRHPDPRRRPTADEAAQRLAALADERAPTRPVGALPPSPSPSSTLRAIVSHIQGSATPGRSDRLFPADPAVFSGNALSVAYGAAGVVHALHTVEGTVSARFLSWLTDRRAELRGYPSGMYLGLAGIAVVLDELGLREIACDSLRWAYRNSARPTGPGILDGLAGFGLGCLRLWCRGPEPWLLDHAAHAGDRLLGTAETESGRTWWRDTDGSVPVGYARGTAGIALFLLYLSLATGQSRYREAAERAIVTAASAARPLESGVLSFPAAARGDAEVLHYDWFAGTAGVITALTRFLAVTGAQRYRSLVTTLARDCARVFGAGPGLFHGLAGAGNSLLDVYEATGEDQYLRQADRTAEAVVAFRVERPDGHGYPGAGLRRISTDLATGGAGIALFLHRLHRVRAGEAPADPFKPDELIIHRKHAHVRPDGRT